MAFNLNDSYNDSVTRTDIKSETTVATKNHKSNKSKYNLKIDGGYVTLVDNYEPSDDPCDFCIHKKELDVTVSTGTISNGVFSKSVDICSTCKHNKSKRNITSSIPTYPSDSPFKFDGPYVGGNGGYDAKWPNVVYTSYNGSITNADSNAVKSYSDK